MLAVMWIRNNNNNNYHLLNDHSVLSTCWVLPHLNLIILLSIDCINGPNYSSLLVSTFFACNCVMPSHWDSGLNSSSALVNRVLATKIKIIIIIIRALKSASVLLLAVLALCLHHVSLTEDERLLAHRNPSHPRWGHLRLANSHSTPRKVIKPGQGWQSCWPSFMFLQTMSKKCFIPLRFCGKS